MEFSFYGWLWIILGAVFVPMEVTAYIVSIVKVVLDRYRIKKTNTARRQSKLTGVPSGKRINIIIIKDEERVFRIMSNGNCQGNHKKSISAPTDTSSNAEDSTESDQHKQNGGHSLQVTVEYNLEVHSISGDIALLQHGQILKENSFKKITASKRSVTIDGDNVANYASFYDSNAKIGIVSNSGTSLADADKIVSSSSISLPDLYCDNQTKQPPPPKPKRNPCAINKKASITETEKSSNNIHMPVIEAEMTLAKDISDVNKCQNLTTSSDSKKCSLSADLAQGSRGYSATSATNTDGEAIRSSPNATDRDGEVIRSSPNATDRDGEVIQSSPNATDRDGEVIRSSPNATYTYCEVIQSSPNATNRDGEVIRSSPNATYTYGEVIQSSPNATDRDGEVIRSSPNATYTYGEVIQSSPNATDKDGEVIRLSPNRSRSEDSLLGSSREVHLTKSCSQGDVNTGHANMAFTDSSEGIKTNF